MLRSLILAAALLAPLSAGAVQPDEILEDPALEARAREISKEIRCPVCRNESIDDSNSGVARDLRLVIRERLEAGDSNDETVAYLTDRYGDYVLLKPRFSAGNLAIWAAGPALLLIGGFIHLIGARLFDARTGFWAAAFYAAGPGVVLSSMLMTTDPPMMVGWALALYAYIRAVEPVRIGRRKPQPAPFRPLW